MLLTGGNSGRPIAPISSPDPNFANVSFLSGFNGVNDGIVFVDEGPNAVAITRFGSAKTSTVGLKFGTTGLNVNAAGGASDWLNIGSPATCGCDFGTGDFTIETWFNSTDSGGPFFHSIIGNYRNAAASGSWSLFVTGNSSTPTASVVHFRAISEPSSGYCTTSVTSGWHHVAISRNAGVVRQFVDGVMESKLTGWAAFSVGGSTAIIIGGNQVGPSDQWRGYIDELRITKGVGRYNSDGSFTPPIAAYPRA